MAYRWDGWSWLGLGLLIAVVLLGFAISHGFMAAWDQDVAEAMSLRGAAANGHLSSALQITAWLGHFGPRMGITLLFAIAVYFWRGSLAMAAFMVAPLLASGYSSVLKHFFARPRPDIIAHLDPVTSASYPSGHATGAMLLYGMLIMVVPCRWRGAATVLAAAAIFMTGWSRLALGVHWASDIAGGTLLGLGTLLIVRPFLIGVARC